MTSRPPSRLLRLPVERYRRILGADRATLSDEDLERTVEALRMLADVAIERARRDLLEG